MHREVRLHRLAEQHLGLVTRAQLRALEFSSSAIARLVERGVLVRLQPTVYRCCGRPPSHDQALLAACLAAGDGVAISHRAAARRWELTDRFTGTVELTVPRGRSPRVRNATVHRSSYLGVSDIRWRDGLPVTSVDRTLVDLGAVCSLPVVAEAMEQAVIDRRTTIDHLYDTLDEIARPGRRGVTTLRTALDDWLLGEKPPDSALELMMARVVRRYGLPPPVFQHEVRAGGRFVARVDFAWPARMLIVEVDGLHTHATAAALQHDLRRQNELVGLGYRVLRFGWVAVVREPGEVAAGIAALLVRAVAA